ncbi:YueI family protein [Alkalicoccobacillus porphyridii]|nr:YueI family protein [Alkalicoccobacillus porphyridii]
MKKVNDILEEAIYGKPEIRPQERKLFLSTIMERVYLALTIKQVLSSNTYQQISSIMQSKKDLHLYINGHLSYQFYSKYTKLASTHSVPFTIVTPTEGIPTGLVLASANSPASPSPASIFVEDSLHEKDMKEFNKD